MFSYFGSKSKIVNYYPPPDFDTVIEPFCGSARYALKYWDRKVIIADKYKIITDVWKYLQQCSKNDILKLPILKTGMDIRTLNLSDDELKFVGFMAGVAQGKPVNKVTPFAGVHFGRKNNKYVKVAENLDKIRHWKILNCSYTEIENTEATWFIDPPYQFGGQHQYVHGNKNFDYAALKNWVDDLKGQAIVCENSKAKWLRTLPLKSIQGVANTHTVESIYLKNFDAFYEKLHWEVLGGL